MPIYHRLAQDDQGLRRTIADALVVLRTIPDFTDQSRANIRVQPLKLTSGELVGLIDLEFKGPLPEVTCIVSLATSSRFRAKWQGSEERHDRDVFELDGALVDGSGNVTLADGPLLQSVEFIPARLPMTASELDCRIVYHVLALIGQQDDCYRRLREGVPDELQDMVPDRYFLDCSKLYGLAVPPLKVITHYLSGGDANLKPSPQKISDALRKFGMRIPFSRPRASRQVYATM